MSMFTARSALASVLAICACKKPTEGDVMTTDGVPEELAPKPKRDAALAASATPEPQAPNCEPAMVREDDGGGPKGDIVAPLWQKGDAWVVRYCLEEPTLKGDLRRVEILWEYRVVEVIDSKRVDILAHRLTHDIFGDWHLLFVMAGQFVAYREGRNEDEVPSGPYLPVSDDWNAEALPKAWPAFPLKSGARKKHRNGVLQEVFADPAGRRVVLRASGDGDGVETDKTMQQIWEPGRPFWSSMKIESVSQLPDGPYHSVDIEGVVIDWKPGARNP